MNQKNIIKKNITSVSIILFVTIFSLIQYFQPSIIYNNDGSLRQFGIGTKKKTVLPIWLLSLILAIFSYLFVLYYLSFPKIMY
tara:strand:+ start:192 stop:440 length:249 start_codon:yes stop_codon:yes gene_type:complete